MKKWLCFLLAFGLCAPQAFAADDDWEEEEEEEEEAPKKKAAPKKASKKSEAGDSKIGFAVSFSGYQGNVSFLYDMGSGMEFGFGLGLDRHQGAGADEAEQTIHLIPAFYYELGKALLDYGIGITADYTMLPGDAGSQISGFPHFYVKTELVKNVSLRLSAGLNVFQSEERNPDGEKDMDINLRTGGQLIFYFM